MNDVLQNIMTFINENTYILIGICIFLIFVLIGYLIDNSVKSKRVRKDIKNKDQVPENIKNEIIEEATKDKNQNVEIEEDIKKVEDNLQEMNSDIKQDSNSNIEIENNSNTEDITKPLNLDFSNMDTSYNNSSDIQVNNIDPDSDIMVNNENKEYSNDKKLSEILSEIDKTNSNIFESDTHIELDKNVNNNIQIQPNESESDELERIMKKLSSMESQDEDNYTNIF